MEGYWFICWIICCLIINIIGLFIPLKINYYNGKWGVKKTPIYRLKHNYRKNHYSIFKYELDWDMYYQGDGSILFSMFLIPFSSWLKFPVYEEKRCFYGSF